VIYITYRGEIFTMKENEIDMDTNLGKIINLSLTAEKRKKPTNSGYHTELWVFLFVRNT
jgi:hypothetical protein